MKSLCMGVGLCISLCSLPLDAQVNTKTNPFMRGPGGLINSAAVTSGAFDPTSYHSPKRPGHYTAKDWRVLIDSVWGPGLPTATKLQVFDTFWNLVDREYAGFPYLGVNWDSMKTLYRPEVAAGVSRGRFGAIMCQLYLPLSEIHTFIGDAGIDSSYWQGSSSVYRPGLPTFFTNGWGPVGNFGAALTPLPDSSLLVYRAIASHPLGLVAGDIILGYDRIPWKQLYKDLIAAQLPFVWWFAAASSTQRSMTHALLNSAGYNWGLFDTIDVVKYTTGDTLHLATAPLTGLNWLSLFASEQVPVSGVTMPDYLYGDHVTWGIVQNTSIGYVYVYGWESADASLVAHALDDLINVKKVTGLILDFRFNTGTGGVTVPSDAWYSYLFSQIPGTSSQWQDALRSDPSNHFSFVFSNPWPASFIPRPDSYDRPIAVLLGPAAWSNGDLHAFRMRFHPMARSFGLPTNGSFPAFGHVPYVLGAWGSWYYQHVTGQMRSFVNSEGFLMHKGFPVDEEVWLTRDGVAEGQDDVVKRAIEWITTLAYAHDVQVSRQGTDTVRLTANVENSLAHSLKVVVTYKDTSGTVADSSLMYNDGLHGDGAPGDSVWGWLYLPALESVYHLSVRTDDLTAGTSRTLPDAAQFVYTHKALVSMDTRTVALGNIYHALTRFDTTFQVSDIGWSPDSIYVALDPILTPDSAISVSPVAFALAPGGSQTVTFSVMPHWLSKGVTYNAVVMVDSRFGFGQARFEKAFSFGITPVSDEPSLPKAFALQQNYPNPFNPSTTIEYELPKASEVRLSVYDMLGREVSVLVNERMDAGVHEVKFDGSNLASGVYLYRLQARQIDGGQAGDYLDTKRFVLLK